MPRNQNSRSVHTGHARKETGFEKAVDDWIVEQRESKILVSTGTFIARSSTHDSSFKDGHLKDHFHCVCPLLIQRKLGIWIVTRARQKRNSHLFPVHETFVRENMSKFAVQEFHYGLELPLLVNMDEKSCSVQIPISNLLYGSSYRFDHNFSTFL